MKIRHDLPSVEEYKKLRSLVGWFDTDENSTKIALENSLFSVVATISGKIVGTGRIAGDGGLYFYIQDLIVHPKFQSQGVGRAIMEELMHFIRNNAKPGSYIALMAAPGLKKYYEAFGFTPRKDVAPGMYMLI